MGGLPVETQTISPKVSSPNSIRCGFQQTLASAAELMDGIKQGTAYGHA